MDALKYGSYMSAASQGLGLYPGSTADPSAALKSMYPGQDGAGLPSSSATGQDQAKTSYSADSLSRSYLEQQQKYYGGTTEGTGAAGGLKTGGAPSYDRTTVTGNYGETTKSYTPDSMSGRQSDSPDMKKTTPDIPGGLHGGGGGGGSTPFSQQQAALQAYYSQSMASMGLQQPTAGAGGAPSQAAAGGALPPLLPMAAQLSQYAGSVSGSGVAGVAGYPQASVAGDYSRRPLSVLF